MRYCIISIFFIIGCHSEEKITPPVSLEVQRQVLIDFHMADATLRRVSPEEKDSVRKQYYQEILNIYSLTTEEYEELLEYWKQNPNAVLKIYDQSIDSLRILSGE